MKKLIFLVLIVLSIHSKGLAEINTNSLIFLENTMWNIEQLYNGGFVLGFLSGKIYMCHQYVYIKSIH